MNSTIITHRHTAGIVLLLAFAISAAALGQVRVLSADDRGVTIEYSPEVAAVMEHDGQMELGVKDADQLFTPGQPRVPLKILCIAVPPGSKPVANVLSRVPGKSWNSRLRVTDSRDPELANANPARYTSGERIAWQRTSSLAGFQVLYVGLYAADYDAAAPRMELAAKMNLRVDFNTPKSSPAGHPAAPSRLAASLIANYDQATHWPRVSAGNLTGGIWPQGYLYRFNIDREGIYRLTFEQMRSGGVKELGSGIPSANLKLLGNGGAELPEDPTVSAPYGLEQCAIDVEDGGDGLFQPGDYILFYGRGAGGWNFTPANGWRFQINHYAVHNVYWLNLDPAGGGLRMSGFNDARSPDTTVSVGVARIHYEPEQFIFGLSDFPGTGREWYGFTFTGPSRMNYTFTVDSPDTSLPAELTLRVLNAGGGSRLSVTLNNQPLGDYSPGTYPIRIFTLPGGLLRNGFNSLAIEQTSTASLALFDWLDVSWHTSLNRTTSFTQFPKSGVIGYDLSGMTSPLVFNVTEHASVSVERGGRFTIVQDQNEPRRFFVVQSQDLLSVDSRLEEYVPPSAAYGVANLWSPANRLDALLIVPDDYFDAAKPLIDHYARTGRGLSAAAIRLSEVFNRFSGGVRDPAAIRNMLMFAQGNWADPPDYVAFCGDGDYNYRDIGRSETPQMLPPYESGSSCTDDWFSDFSKPVAHVYPLPSMITGRLTANSERELENIISKTISYEENPEFGLWRNSVTLVADDEFADDYNYEWQHVYYTEGLSENYIPKSLDRTKIYLTEYARQWGREKPQAAADLVKAINAGTLVVNYMGHGNPTLWAHEHVFVQSRDMAQIEPSRELPLYTAFTCDWAYWDDPTVQSFPEQMLALPDRGAAAVVASNRLTYGDFNMGLALNFFSHLFDSDTSIGLALTIAKHLYASPNSIGYHLLGDPAMVLGFPRLNGRFTAPDTFSFMPLAKYHLGGEIFGRNDNVDPNFQGTLILAALDTKVPHTYIVWQYDSDGDIVGNFPLHYSLSGPIIYRGLLSVAGGRFQGQMIVPRDVTLGGTDGRVAGYFYNDATDGVIVRDSVLYSGTVAAGGDSLPPQITLYLDYRGWRPGDHVGPDPLLIVDLTDSSGINLTGAMGHGINLSIDGASKINLTPYFSYARDRSDSGSVISRIGPLSAGRHRLEIEAWDSYDNLSVAGLDVEVQSSGGGLIVDRVLNYPNPFNKATQLTFVVNSAASYDAMIYTVGGRLIREYHGDAPAAGLVVAANWDGRDSAGRSVGNGVYLLKINVRDGAGNEGDGLGKIVVAR